MFCKKVSNTKGDKSNTVVNVNNNDSNKKFRKNIYLGMSSEEYLSLFNTSFLDSIKKEKNRKKIYYIPHATWQDIGITKTSRVHDGKIHRDKK